MPEKSIATEELLQCRACMVRMFARDCERHARGHGLLIPVSDIESYFVKGTEPVPSVPGPIELRSARRSKIVQ